MTHVYWKNSWVVPPRGGTPGMHGKRMFDFPSSCPHFRMEMEARSIELVLVQGISTRNYSGIAHGSDDLHLEIRGAIRLSDLGCI